MVLHKDKQMYQASYFRPQAYASIAIGAASVSYTLVLGGLSVIRLQSSCDCWVRIDSAGTAAVAQPGGNTLSLTTFHGPQYFRVQPGDVISVIQNGAVTGNLSITEMTR